MPKELQILKPKGIVSEFHLKLTLSGLENALVGNHASHKTL